MKTHLGEVEINGPRDCNGELEPKIISKYQSNADGIEERILSLQKPTISSYPYKIREDHQVVTKAAYVILGIKEVLGLWGGASESAKYWMGVLIELKSIGAQNVSLFCVAGLTGFKEAIMAVYPIEMHHPPDPQQYPFCER